MQVEVLSIEPSCSITVSEMLWKLLSKPELPSLNENIMGPQRDIKIYQSGPSCMLPVHPIVFKLQTVQLRHYIWIITITIACIARNYIFRKALYQLPTPLFPLWWQDHNGELYNSQDVYNRLIQDPGSPTIPLMRFVTTQFAHWRCMNHVGDWTTELTSELRWTSHIDTAS
jgi:hypothetical protein